MDFGDHCGSTIQRWEFGDYSGSKQGNLQFLYGLILESIFYYVGTVELTYAYQVNIFYN